MHVPSEKPLTKNSRYKYITAFKTRGETAVESEHQTKIYEKKLQNIYQLG